MRSVAVVGVMMLAAARAPAAEPSSAAPIIAPPAGWVRTVAPPSDIAAPDEAAVRILFQNQQVRLTREGVDVYIEMAARVQTPQGLAMLGTLAFPWKPDTGTLTVHKLVVRRGAERIDLLGQGQGFTVLRRENNLENAALDGILTAVIQPAGLEVGDVIEQAVTISSRDPVLAGHPEGGLAVLPGVPIDRVSLRAQWDSGLPVRWRQLEGLPRIVERKAGGVTEISVSADKVEPLLLPKFAPPRFALNRVVQLTSFASWGEVSALFAPLYAKAAVIGPRSPIRPEIERIAAASSDPVKRAEAALALVEDKVRYVFLGMADGGLVPASADETWARRFGDCKGKTALLLAVLDELGIEAVPALVSARLGDGLDARLPMVGAFDHVIVRATIAGKTYWLDGTRTGDKRLADLEVPPYKWALPLTPTGGTLEALAVPPPDKPTAAYRYTLDFTAGATRPAPFHVEETTRGDEAIGIRLQIANLVGEARDRMLREYLQGRYRNLTVTKVAVRFDDSTGETTIVGDGTLLHDFAKFRYDPEMSGLGFNADFERKEGAHRDAPYVVAYPRYVTTEQTILLPNGGAGFTAGGGKELATTIAGVEYKRSVSLKDGTYRISTSERSIAPEFPASEAVAAQAALRALDKDDAWIATTAAYRPTREEEDAALNEEAKDPEALVRRAYVYARRQEFSKAIEAIDRALAIDPAMLPALLARGSTKLMMGKGQEALADFDRAIAAHPKDLEAQAGRAGALMAVGRRSQALTSLNQLVAAQPDNSRFRLMRAQVHLEQKQLEPALADATKALALSPGMAEALAARMTILRDLKSLDEAAADALALIEASPDNVAAMEAAGRMLIALGRKTEARQAYDRIIALEPSAHFYVRRAEFRAPNDFAGRSSDADGALKLNPTYTPALLLKAETQTMAKEYAAAITTAGDILSRTPTYVPALIHRGVAYALSGRTALAEADFAAVRRVAARDPANLNEMCWIKARFGVALASALDDCDAALKIQPEEASFLDSRGFVLLRLGRYDEAMRAFDKVLAKRPELPTSLYGRGVARRLAGRASEGDADIAKARALWADVLDAFAPYEMTV